MIVAVMTAKKSPGGRRKDPTYQQVNLSLKPELVKKLKLVALEYDLNLSELAEIAFNDYLQSLNKEV